VGVLSVMLLGTQGGPPFTGDTSLFQFFGYFGLFCATVLTLRVDRGHPPRARAQLTRRLPGRRPGGRGGSRGPRWRSARGW
jgi:hypothetical protein